MIQRSSIVSFLIFFLLLLELLKMYCLVFVVAESNTHSCKMILFVRTNKKMSEILFVVVEDVVAFIYSSLKSKYTAQ